MDCCQRSPVAPFTVTWMIPTYGQESVKSGSEASGFLVVPLVFKTRERRAASLAGSIPVRLRHQHPCREAGADSPVHRMKPRFEVRGMSAFGHYLLACRWRAGACQSGTIGQGPLH